MISIVAVKTFLLSSKGRILLVLFVFLLTYLSATLLKILLEKYFKKSTRFIKVDNTQYSFVKHFMTALIYLVGVGVAVYLIPSFRAFSVSLFAGAGVLAVILGFASQQAFSNIISGLFIVFFRPFRVGDWIKVRDIDNVSGFVEDITLRHTVIKNFENKRIIIPNAVINNEVIENKHIEDAKICKFFEMGISYDSDADRAMEIMAEEAMKHPSFLDVRTDEEKEENIPPVKVKIIGFGESSVQLRAWIWTRNPITAFHLGCDLNKLVKDRFQKEGIEIPFPYRTMVYKKDLPKNPKYRQKKPKTIKPTSVASTSK